MTRPLLFTPFILALLLAFLMEPLVCLLLPYTTRQKASILVLSTYIALLVLAVSLLLPILLREATSLITAIPSMVQLSELWLGRQLFYLRESMGVDLPGFSEWMREQAPSFFAQGVDALGHGTKWLASGVTAVFSSLINVILVPIFAWKLSANAPAIRKESSRMIPDRAFIHDLIEEMQRVFAGYFRGQFLVSLSVGVLASLGLWFIGMPWPVLLGLAIGAFNVIPLVGPGSMYLLASLVACFQPEAFVLWIKLTVVFALVQGIETFFITPRILGRSLGVPAVLALAALFFFGSLFGPFGLILAIPLAAILIFLWRSTRPDVQEEQGEERCEEACDEQENLR
jgi:predicted PurR-regulated permease PerM